MSIDCIPPNESEEINLYDILEAGTYNVSIIVTPYYDKDNRVGNESIFNTVIYVDKNGEIY